MPSPNLQIAEIQATQDQKEVTHNAAVATLDNAMNARVTKAITTDTAFTTAETRQSTLIELTGTPGAARNVDMPDTEQRVLTVFNNTDALMTIRNSAGAGAVAIAVGNVSTFHYDGVAFTELAAPGGGAGVEDEGVSVVASASTFDFVGAGVVASDGGGGKATITIAGGGGGPAQAGAGIGDGPELLIDRTFAASAAEEFKDFSPVAGETYFMEIMGIANSADDTGILLTVSKDNGATFEVTNYHHRLTASQATAGNNTLFSVSGVSIPLVTTVGGWGLNTAAGSTLHGIIEFGEIGKSGTAKPFRYALNYIKSGLQTIMNENQQGGWIGGTDVLNAFKLAPESGTFSGRVRLWRRLATPSSVGIENLIINGDFRVAQRGTAFTAATIPVNGDDTYLLDRWLLLSDGADVADVSQDTTAVPAGAHAAMKAIVATANKKFGFLQILEARDAAKIIGGKASLQFKVRSTTAAALAEIRVGILSWSGTADAPVSDVVAAWGLVDVDPTLVADWTYENVASNIVLSLDNYATVTLADIAIDTASAKNVAVFIWVNDTDASLGDELFIADVKLNQGAAVAGFEMRPFEQELALCGRFYTKTFPQAVAPAQNAGVAGSLVYRAQFAGIQTWPMTWPFQIRMRDAPAITYYNPGAANALWRNTTDAGDSAAAVTEEAAEHGLTVSNAQVGTDGVGEALRIHASADAEL